MVQSQARSGFTIGALAEAAGIGVETVRFYQRKGLIETPERGTSIRRYDGDALRRLLFIRQAQAAGFTLKEISELLELDSGQDRARARELATRRVAALDDQIREMRKARDALAHLAKECSEGGAGPCPILASFDQSSRSRSLK